MKEIPEYEKDIASIRNMMERSSKFISLSGLSGVLAGIYALIGSVAAYYIVQFPRSPVDYRTQSVQEPDKLWRLILIASLVFIASIATGLYQSSRKAKKHGLSFWNTTTKRLIINLTIPLATGGIFILTSLYNGHYGLAAPASLIFYGLALIHASSNLYDEIRYLGICEIILGLIATILPGYGLIFWAIGFGVLHIFYGAVMYKKYDT